MLAAPGSSNVRWNTHSGCAVPCVLDLQFKAVFEAASVYYHMCHKPSLLVSAQIWC